jgi:lipoprotein-anchoring transpeptidase ErfK/SrfK
LALTACTASTPSSPTTVTKTAVASTPATKASAPKTAPKTTPKPTKKAAPTKPVHVSSLETDGSTWGVGMPIVLYFDKMPGTSRYFTAATKVTVNGQPSDGAWFWEKSERPGAVVEAHYRPRAPFWPAHAQIHVTLPPAGTSAGPGLHFDGQLSSVSMATGAADIGTVGADSKLTVTVDGKPIGTFPLALGAASTPTMNGIKVIMAKGRNERMIGSGYDEIVPWSMRLTNSGEYLHAASWNIGNIMSGTPSSNGCSNMLPADAQKLFGIMQIGDPVIYNHVPDATSTMPSWDGFGDWNLPWSVWSGGGLLLNHTA